MCQAGLVKTAIKMALAADPGGPFWSAFLGGFAVAFLITTPVNKSMTGRGKGHAVVHTYH